MKSNILIKYLFLILFIGLMLWILLDFPGSSRKSFNFYCEQVTDFYKIQFQNGIVVENEIEINNHGIRELIISTDSGSLIKVRIIDPIDWENVDKLSIGESVSKNGDSFVIIRQNEVKLNILTYCDDFFMKY